MKHKRKPDEECERLLMRGEMVKTPSFRPRRATNSAAGQASAVQSRSPFKQARIRRIGIASNARSLLAFLVVAGACLALCRPDAIAQTTIKPSDELRPLYATLDDIAEGKELAQTSCAACHGTEGISANEGVPNLAGQRPAYLYTELKAYQSGARSSLVMLDKVVFLSDDALVKVAAYYAGLDPAQPAAAEAPAYVDPVQAGKTAAAACSGCHGEAGVSNTPGTPNLLGLAPQYLVAAMTDYRSGQRKNDTMKAMVAALTDDDINHIALFYALQKPARAQTPGSGDAEAGKAIAAGCAGCHGDQGVSGNPVTPSLAGQEAGYLAAALTAYKDETRSNETMTGLAKPLDEAGMKNVASYYAALEPQRVNVSKPLTPNEWSNKCDRCHGPNGNSTRVDIPALAGQRMDYLEAVLHDYQTRARRDPEMAAMVDVLSADDIKGLAAQYSRQKARAVVFVTVPSK